MAAIWGNSPVWLPGNRVPPVRAIGCPPYGQSGAPRTVNRVPICTVNRVPPNPYKSTGNKKTYKGSGSAREAGPPRATG
jgi:hypothetical protein